MSELFFDELANTHPETLSRRLRKKYQKRGQIPENLGIHSTAKFEEPVMIHSVKKIGAMSVIHAGTTLESGVHLGNIVNVGGDSYFCRNSRVGSLADIGYGFYAGEDAELSGEYTARSHDYKRTIRALVTVGPGVVLPSEVQLGDSAVIPTSDSIGQIGRFGTSHRMVTAYGSLDGPRYSVGCQFGIDIGTFKDRVSSKTETTYASSQDYFKHMPEIEALGGHVQAAYERDFKLVEELAEARMSVITPEYSPLEVIQPVYR